MAQVLFVPHQAHGNIGLPKRQVPSVSFPGLFFFWRHCFFLHFKRPLLKLINIPYVADVDPEIILASSSVWKPRKAREKYLPKSSRLSTPFPVPLGGNGRRKGRSCRSPFAVFQTSLPNLPQEVLGIDERRTVTDVVDHHEPVRPVHGLLQDAPCPRALPRTTQGFSSC